MKSTAITQLIVCLIMFLSTPILAQNSDVDGSKDHPLVTRLPDFYIGEYGENEFAKERFNTETGTVPVEGHKYKIDYRLKDNIAKNQLEPKGLGPLAPVSTNRTAEGKAKNRRVELVENLN